MSELASFAPPWIAIVAALRIVSIVAWAIPALYLAPALWRLYVGRSSRMDIVWALLCFLSLSTITFSVRWLIFPAAQQVMGDAELAFWSGAHVLSILCATGVIGVRFFYGRG